MAVKLYKVWESTMEYTGTGGISDKIVWDLMVPFLQKASFILVCPFLNLWGPVQQELHLYLHEITERIGTC